MLRQFLLCGAAAVLVFSPVSAGKPPPLPQPAKMSLPLGRWSVEFANGVTQVCEFRQDGTASVVELALPSYSGTVTLTDGAVLIEYTGDRSQRFTPVGQRMVVEHWSPGAKKAAARPILGIAERIPKNARAGLRHSDGTRGFHLTVPEDWSVVSASFPVMHYRDVFLCINSRGDKALRVTDKRDGDTVRYNAETVALQLEPGTVYIDLAYFEGPGVNKLAGVPDFGGSDLATLLDGLKATKSTDGKLSTVELSFVERERRWSIHAYFREPVKDDVREKAWEVLRSYQLIESQRQPQSPAVSGASRSPTRSSTCAMSAMTRVSPWLGR